MLFDADMKHIQISCQIIHREIVLTIMKAVQYNIQHIYWQEKYSVENGTDANQTTCFL